MRGCNCRKVHNRPTTPGVQQPCNGRTVWTRDHRTHGINTQNPVKAQPTMTKTPSKTPNAATQENPGSDAPLSAAELSYTMWRYRNVHPTPCIVCGSDMRIVSMGGGQPTEWACDSDAARFLDSNKTKQQRNEAEEHYQRSKQFIIDQGDSTVVTALRQLRDLRAAAGEDMNVPVDTVFLVGGSPYLRHVHLGNDAWKHHLGT